MKKRRMRLTALLVVTMMLCGLAIAEPVHEHQWSAWQKSADNVNQEVRTCIECNAVETREHQWGPWMDQGDGTEKHICSNCQKEEIRKIETPQEPVNEGTGGENADVVLLNDASTTPDGGAGTTPDDGTGTTPDDGTGTTPDDGTGTTPDDGTGTTPDDGTGTTPDDGTGTTPDDGAGTTPDDGTGTTPDDGTGTTPDDGTGTTPDDGTGTTPDGVPEADPNGGQDITPLIDSELQISLTADKEDAAPGDTLTYTVTVTNNGDAAAENVELKFTLPDELEIVATAYGEMDPTYTLEKVEAKGTSEIWLKAQVSEQATQGQELEVTASAGTTPITYTVKTLVLNWPVLEITTCEMSQETSQRGAQVPYTVKIKNTSSVTAYQVKVKNLTSDGIDFAEPDKNPFSIDKTDTYDKESNIWTINDLAPGVERELGLLFNVEKDVLNGQVLSVSSQITDISIKLEDDTVKEKHLDSPIENTATTTAEVGILTIGIAVDEEVAATGSVINYIVTVTDKGNGSASFAVQINLPENVQVRKHWESQGTQWYGDRYLWDQLAPSRDEDNVKNILKLEVVVTDTEPGQVTTASAEIIKTIDKKPIEDYYIIEKGSDSVSFIGENAASNLSILNTVDKPGAKPGEELCYTLTITNNGGAPIKDIRVSDKLPDKVQFSGKELPDGTTYDEVSGEWIIPELEQGAQAILRLKGVMNADVGESVISTAEITSVEGFEPELHPSSSASVLVTALNYGFLTVNETVTGSGASKRRDFPFQVTFADASGKAVSGVGVFVKGTESRSFDTASPITFELRHDETVWIGVPSGLSYTVTETDTKGYGLTSKNDKGVIQTDQLIQATFVNDRQRNTDIPKTGYADQAPDAAVEQPAVAEDLTQAYAQNDDLVGWLKAGDGIDLPVVQSDNTYYLDHGFTGEENKNGTLFLNMNNQLFPADDVLLIHGHNMKDGSMFGTLSKFEQYDYACEHPIVTFQTIHDEEPVYHVPISVFNASMLPDHSSYFDITQIVFPDDEEGGEEDSSTFRQSTAFKTYLEEIQAESLWDSPVDVNVDDKLLMLITCSYDLEDGRLMVVCRKLRDGETPEEVAELFAK